jgi:nitroimidazol reductase NimA-like FMN-containing flavoprotein (pyridoxamine 5'-phosphate oxidase superfamily)
MPLTDQVRSLLKGAMIARLSVIDRRGYPHTVPIWFATDGDDLMFFSSRSARKIGYVQVNPKGAISIGGDPYGEEGYLLKGEFSLEEDGNHRWLSEIVHRYEPKELADKHVVDWGAGDLVLMRFKVQKVSRIE